MYYCCKGRKEKEERIADILSTVTVGQCIIFVHTRESVETLGNMLKTNGHSVSMLHGRMEETNRDKVLLDFRAGVVGLVRWDYSSHLISITCWMP